MKEPMKKIKLFAAMLATGLTLGAVADVVPFGIFNSGMVLPRDRIVTVWGKADVDEPVSVAFAGQSVATTADAKGDWLVQLAAMEANKTGRTMTITGKNVITLENVLVGDVWLCAGQSNMAMQYNDDNDIVRPYLSEADGYSMIRSINGVKNVQNFAAESPWVVAASNTLGKITLAGYFFARRIVKETGVPIGLVDTSVPGVGIESFLGPQVIDYNRSIAPFGFKGAIWYQGESNCGDNEAYRFKMTQLVGEWREALAMPELPFFYVQLCAYGDSSFTQLREAQRMAMTMILEPVGMACTIDIGDFGGLHPFNKYDVGERLAAWALNKTYGKTEVVVSGPLYKSIRTEGNQARLSFDFADGLKLGKKGGIEFVENPAPTMADVVKKFKIAGSDGVWYDADSVEFSGGDVLVSSASVSSPTAVRYAYEKNPSGVFVYNSANLPMVPFRTDYDPDYFGQAPDWTPPPEVTVAVASNLVYTGSEQVGVAKLDGYTLWGDTAATKVGDYEATATLEDGYVWSDRLKSASRKIKWSIGKGQAVLSGRLILPNYEFGTTPPEPAGLTTSLGEIAYAYFGDETGSTPLASRPTAVGAYYVRGEVAGTDQYFGVASPLYRFAIYYEQGSGEPVDPVNYTSANGFAEALAAASNLTDSAPAQGGDYILSIDNGDGSTDYVHVFTTPGAATFTTVDDLSARILLVGGGGGGAGGSSYFGRLSTGGGGGGAGGLVQQFYYGLGAGDYTVTVGEGGKGCDCLGSYAANGGTSELALKGGDTLLSAAGGGGGSTYNQAGRDGGCGGGAGGHNESETAFAGGEGALGFDGGSGKDGVKCAGSGGGGMGAVGESATGEKSGNGGDGQFCVITGLPIWYAGGGAGGSINAQYGTGGLGGGASATSGSGANGANGLGGGGAGGKAGNTAGGNGGSGVVIIRYTVNGSGPRKAVVPTGKTLTYTGNEQTGVDARAGSTLSGVVKATEANDEYKATAMLIDGYEWADGLANAPREIKWSIAKATPVISGTLAMAGWKEGETASEPSGLSSSFGAVTYAYYAYPACEQAIDKPTTEGTYYVRGEVAASANWNAAVSSAKAFTISKAGGGGDEPVVPPSGDGPTVKIVGTTGENPWQSLTVNYTLNGIDANTDYKLVFGLSVGGATKAVTNAAARLTDGAASKFLDTAAILGFATNTDHRVSVRVSLIEIEKKRGVQLWENGPYWSEFNVGASKPEEYGMLTRFDHAPDDVRTNELFGASWRVPTIDELWDLTKFCEAEKQTLSGIVGCRFTGKINRNSIFLPAAGCLHGDVPGDIGVRACSFSCDSFIDDDGNQLMYYLSVRVSSTIPVIKKNYSGRYAAGATVRPVRDPTDPIVASDDYEIDLVSYTTANGFAEALAADTNRIDPDAAPAQGGDYVLALDNGDGSTDYVHVFLTAGKATFTTENDLTARVLLVGGGGGGGGPGTYGGTYKLYGGGGGGAGALVEHSGLSLVAGNYGITIGAGGAGRGLSGSVGYGENGGTTTLASGETILLSAVGGGGGGSNLNDGNGKDGACGGGAGGHGADVTEAYPGGKGASGQDGGSAPVCEYCCGAGGGGMDGQGEDGSGKGSGDGGKGDVCDITGHSVYYAGGGAGGSLDKTRTGGVGGLGGGGSSFPGVEKIDGVKPGDGVGGLGGGGAGSSYLNNVGGNGGSGAVIIRYTVGGSGPRKAVVPTGKTLTYTGKEQVGVEAKPGSTLSGVVKATDANDEYKATATLIDGYEWADGVTDVSREIKWLIVKATPVISGTLVMAGWKEGETASEPNGLSANFGVVAYAYYDDQACTQAIAKPTTEGTYYVRGEVVASANWNAAVSAAKQFKITEAGGGDEPGDDPEPVAKPTVTVDAVATGEPWSTITVEYTLDGLDAETKYALAFEVTAGGLTRGVTNAQAILTAGVATQEVDTVALFGSARSDANARVRVALLAEGAASGGVQLWADGPYWAECNLGASSPEDCGNKMNFAAAIDTVNTDLGSSWRLPSRDEVQGLITNCISEWTSVNDVYGRRLTSKFNGSSIFLPITDANLQAGFYWTAEENGSDFAFCYSFGSSVIISVSWAGRATPLGVRAVTDGLGGEGVVASGEKSLELVPSGDEPALQAKVPTGKTLTYTGKEQVGVEALAGSTLSDVVKATDANDEYKATATLVDGYEWADGFQNTTREIAWSIAKATPVISGTLAMAGWKEGKTASEPSGLTADFGAVTYAYYADQTCTQAIAKPTTEGTYYVRGEVAASANWNAAVSEAKAFTIAEAGGEDAINFTTVDGFEEALKTNEHLVSEAPAQGGDYILKLDNGDGSTDYMHVFMTTGAVKTFTTTDDLVARMLLVGGGGGGGGTGNFYANTYKAIGGGGGGAGAMVERSDYDLAAGTYNIVVGAGGVGAAYFNAGENGGQSSIARDDMEPIVAIGGGGGGSWNTSVQNAHDGACGGGACGTGNSVASCKPGKGDHPGQDGGSVTDGQDCSGAGGGGWTTAGKGSTGLESGGGGDGDINNILGCPIYFAGGGAGGVSGTSTQYGSGGLGGGASATSGNGAPGVNGLGGGGSGGSNLGTASGGNGGSGVVIIRYTVGAPIPPEPGRTVTVTRGEGIADIATASGSVFADDAKSATVELAAGAETLELTLVASGDLVIPAYKLVTNSVTNVTVRTATYAVSDGEALTFLATEAGEDETLGADETLSAIVDAIDDSDEETHAAAVAKVTAIASAGEGGRRMVEPRELAAWIADNRVASAELAASDYVVASVKLDTDKPITEEAAVAFSGIAANADTGIVLEFTLVLEGETDDALALTEGDARKEFIASCIQVTDDLAAGFDGTTIAPDRVEILDGGKVRIEPEAASAAGFCRIVIPKDPGPR